MNVIKRSSLKFQSGIALLQVLLITGVLTVLGLYLTMTAKDHVQIASWANDSNQAYLQMQSAQASLLFTLSTTSFSELDKQRPFNFFGQPFDYQQGVSVSIQDQASLLNIHSLNLSALQVYLAQYGVNNETSRIIYDSIGDWQDLDETPKAFGYEGTIVQPVRNGLIPALTELIYINGVTPDIFALLKPVSTIAPVAFFNPINAPNVLFSAFVTNGSASELLKMRDQGTLTANTFSRVSGVDQDEGLYFYTSSVLNITIKAVAQDSVATKKLLINMQPTKDQMPINILSSKG